MMINFSIMEIVTFVFLHVSLIWPSGNVGDTQLFQCVQELISLAPFLIQLISSKISALLKSPSNIS